MIRKSVAEILDHHVTFALEAIDRMYLNAYVPVLQTGGAVVHFLGIRTLNARDAALQRRNEDGPSNRIVNDY